MARKPPIMQGSRPVREYNLDSPEERQLLNINIGHNNPHPPKISDRYVIYEGDKRAIVEYKSSALHKAIEQLESTAHIVVDAGNPVTYVIIVADEISKTERSFYKQEPRTCKLVDPSNKNRPYTITVRSHTWQIQIFYQSQVNNMYQWTNRNFGGS